MRITCPICKKVLENVREDFEVRPFCSERCKKLDLYNWLTGTYRISRPLYSGAGYSEDVRLSAGQASDADDEFELS